MFCPECGFDADEAKFCPECGADLGRIRTSLEAGGAANAAAPQRQRPAAGRTTGDYGRSRPRTSRPAAQKRPTPRQRDVPRQAARHEARHTPAFVWWLLIGAVVVVVAGVVVFSQSNSGASASQGSTAPISADTSGTYGELVARANGLYDQGAQAQQKSDPAAAARYFAAAATVYGAAWVKQPGDPGVGTDYATSLYYSGDTAGALKQVNVVLAKSPDFQNASLNKGVYLQAAAQTAKQDGQTAKAASLLQEARAAFRKAVSVDPGSAGGQKAASLLKSL